MSSSRVSSNSSRVMAKSSRDMPVVSERSANTSPTLNKQENTKLMEKISQLEEVVVELKL